MVLMLHGMMVMMSDLQTEVQYKMRNLKSDKNYRAVADILDTTANLRYQTMKASSEVRKLGVQ